MVVELKAPGLTSPPVHGNVRDDALDLLRVEISVFMFEEGL